jgi:hypothetical protein
VNAGTGNVNFASPIGGTAPLASLTVNGATIGTTDITTNGPQQFTGNMTMASTYNTNGGNFLVSGIITLVNNSTVNSAGGTTTLSGVITDADGNQETLTINNTGGTVLTGNLGAAGNALGGLTITTTGGLTLPVTFVQGATTLSTTGNVTATNGSNDFIGILSVSSTGAATISLVDVNTLTLGTIQTGSGNISLLAQQIAAGGPITTAGGITISSAGNVTGLDIGGANLITLTGTANTFSLTGVAPTQGFIVDNTFINVLINNAVVSGALLSVNNLGSNLVGGLLADIAAKAADEAFNTDSVAKQIKDGFAGDVGTTPPMDHRIDETGISTPECFEESRENAACK